MAGKIAVETVYKSKHNELGEYEMSWPFGRVFLLEDLGTCRLPTGYARMSLSMINWLSWVESLNYLSDVALLLLHWNSYLHWLKDEKGLVA